MLTDPLVSIVIVNWNGRDVTIECLQSLSKVKYSNFRIIVIDNASTDGSPEAIRSTFPLVTLLTMKENLLFAGGTNAGLRLALSEGAAMMLLLNNDTTVDPEFLGHLVHRLQSDGRAGMAAPLIYYHSAPDRIWSAGGALSFWTGTMKHLGIRELERGQHAGVREVDFASGCCILVKRTVVEHIGLLDESFRMYAEDADWCMKARLHGYSVLLDPAAKIWHKVSVSAGGHLSLFKLRRKFIANLRFFARYAAWYQWLVFPWLNILVNAAAAARYLVQSRRV